jgi:hypothetical protein
MATDPGDAARPAATASVVDTSGRGADATQVAADADVAGSPGSTAAGSGGTVPANGPTGAGPPGVATGAATGGTSVLGVACTGGTRQLPSSRYGAACQRASSGTNPGATSRGVTARTISVSLRVSQSGQSVAVLATGGTATDSLGADQAGVAADMAVFVDYFNKVFDLYGRRVVLHTFSGQGDFLAEIQNQNVSGAQADGARARDLGSFADISIATMTQPYSEALVAQQIVAMSPLYLSSSWYADHAPYTLGVVWPVGDQLGGFMGNVACARMAGQPAAFAGDAALTGRPRTFGIVHPENPEYAKAADAADRALRACGHPPARRIAYALNIALLQQQHTSVVAQMKAAGVTTVLCVCDEFSPIFLSRAADQQHYDPEWLQMWFPDPWARLASVNQWRHSIHTDGAARDVMGGEIGAAWRAAAGTRAPQAPAALTLTYEQALALFSALQAAGPDLTPQSLQRGWASLPSTPEGDLGPWEFGRGILNPKTAYRIGWYNPSAHSAFDGGTGAIRDCDGGRSYRWNDRAAMGSGPLGCFR